MFAEKKNVIIKLYSKKINKKDRKDKSVCVHESQSNPSIKRYIKRWDDKKSYNKCLIDESKPIQCLIKWQAFSSSRILSYIWPNRSLISEPYSVNWCTDLWDAVRWETAADHQDAEMDLKHRAGMQLIGLIPSLLWKDNSDSDLQ